MLHVGNLVLSGVYGNKSDWGLNESNSNNFSFLHVDNHFPKTSRSKLTIFIEKLKHAILEEF